MTSGEAKTVDVPGQMTLFDEAEIKQDFFCTYIPVLDTDTAFH